MLCTGRVIANPDTLRFHDPQARVHSLGGQDTDGEIKTAKDRADGLIRGTQHHNSRRSFRVVPPSIGKMVSSVTKIRRSRSQAA